VSSDQVAQKARETLKAARDMLEKAHKTTHAALEKAAPAVQKSIDSSMEAAAKGFSSTMKSIDDAATGDQVKLLRAYRKFLSGQVDFVESRIKALEGRSQQAE
jgi:vacuolar-type H+-ATPase subunit E/Vma4